MEFDEEEARRDDAFYDELERAYIAELEHVRAGGVDLTKAILREEVYERLIGELEREDVSSDARDAVASFLQDLRRDGVEWHSIGHGRGYFEADDERRVFPEYAAPCTRATRIPGSVCMKFAHEHGAPWDQWTCEYAAGFGNLQSLQYAHEHGCPWDVSTCQAAAEYGHLDCLRYARENGCPWDKRTCDNAARYGHLDCLEYAHENGCPWDENTYFCAMSNGNMEVILFLIEREHPRTQSLRLTWEKVAMPILPDADAVIGLEIALSRHRHRHDADGGHVSLREILPFWREHRRLYDEAHRAARVDALLPEIDEERRRVTDAG